MPTIQLTRSQLYLCTDILEQETDEERKYGDGDKSILNKKRRLRDRFYNAISKEDKILSQLYEVKK